MVADVARLAAAVQAAVADVDLHVVAVPAAAVDVVLLVADASQAASLRHLDAGYPTWSRNRLLTQPMNLYRNRSLTPTL